jgi:sugar/nucleoside kinase (ribokinase family)
VRTVHSLNKPEEINWVHFEGRIPDILTTAIPRIRSILPHAIISVEFEKPDRLGLIDLLPLVDVAFFSHTYFVHFKSSGAGQALSAYDFFANMRQKNSQAIFLLTAGADGAFYSVPGEEGAVPTSHVKLIDATGAGDTFLAGIIWAFGKLKKNVKESVELAVALATVKVSQEGFDGVWTSIKEEMK